VTGWRAMLLVGLALAPGLAAAQEFYAGKTVTLANHSDGGGGYDLWARLLAAHYARYIPGHPKIIVVNQPGAGGLKLFNYLGKVAPRDGTFLALVGQGLVIQGPLGLEGMQLALTDLNWLGNLSQSNNVTVTWHSSPTKTIEDAKRQEVVVGSTGPTGTDAQIPAAYNALLGTRFKVVFGYEGGAQMNLAMQRGEIEGRGTNTWPSYQATMPEDVRAGRLNPLIQIGLRKDPDLPQVPLFLDLVHGDPAKEPVARYLSLTMAVSRPVAAPPGTPIERILLLRRAFDAAVQDPEFRDEARRVGYDIDAMSGVETESAIRQIMDASPETIRRTQAAIGLAK
jgi:tripartite-type tricarboxylate transporter receptor subunit TctC